jgi:hypothetical protein
MLARRLCWFVVAALTLLGAPFARAADFTWTGSAAPDVPNWSDASNWGGSAPGGSVGVLHFPAR